MAKRGTENNLKLASEHTVVGRAIAEHESSIKTLKREVETAPNLTVETRRHLYHMIAKHYELIAKEYRALAKEQG